VTPVLPLMIVFQGIHQTDHILFADFHRPGNTVMLRLTRRYPLFFPVINPEVGALKAFAPL
jgi:hypothetical protein